MANPLIFKPKPVDPRQELQRRLDAAPSEHAEALLVAWDVLQTAHDQGILDLVHGMIGAKDTIAAELAKYAKLPEGVAAIRNLLAAGKLLTVVEPEILDQMYRVMVRATADQRAQSKPMSLWELGKLALGADSRRALGFLIGILTGLGRGLAGETAAADEVVSSHPRKVNA